MSGDTPITLIGNVVADPELRYTSAGVPVSNFRVASTPRTFDRQQNQWVDGEALFLSCNVWREMAENVMESLSKGHRVMVSGKLKQRSYDTREGERRTVFEIEVDEVGPSLRFATAQVTRSQATGNAGPNQGRKTGQSADSGQPAEDPWNSAPSAGDFPAGDQAPY